MNRKSTKIRHRLSFITLAACAMVLTGCSTDDGIDLGDIDTNIGIGSDGFTLPGSSTNYIKLQDVLDLKDDGVVNILENGDYQFQKSDDISSANPKVKQIEFTSPITESYGISVDIDYIPPFGFDWPVETITLPTQELAMFEFSDTEDTQVDHLESAHATGSITLTLNLASLNVAFSKIDASFELPYFLKFGSVSKGTITRDDANQTQKLDVTFETKNNQKITLQLAELVGFQKTKPSGSTPHLVVNANGIDLMGKIQATLSVKQSYQQSTAPSSININIGTDASVSTLTVNEATGYFDPKIDPQTSSVEIGNDIPDFLNDDKVNIMLSNPTIELDINNNINVEAFITGKMIATYKDNSTKVMNFSKTNAGSNITIKPHTAATGTTTSKIVICRKPGNEVGVQYIVKDGTGTEAGEKDLANILKKIPEKLDFTFTTKSDTEYKGSIKFYNPADGDNPSKPGQGYSIEPKYDFKAPLSLDAGSTIVYNDTIKDWNKDLQDNDIDLLKGGKLTVNAKVDNSTPMRLYITPTAIGTDKKAISSITVTVETDKKDAQGYYISSNYGTADASNLTIKLLSNEEGAFKKLDGLAFKVTAVAEQSGITLNSGKNVDDNGIDTKTGKKGQIVRVYDMRATLDGQVIVNLDK